VLSLGKLAPGQQQYYLETVARGAEDYYTGAKEAPGEWTGLSAARLALVDEVDADALRFILESRDPTTGERLTRAQGAPKIPGFDATFCAPKSVSLLFALGEPEVSNEVRNAHDAAVAAALRVLEAEAARARRGRGGTERHIAEGFVSAAFRHRTSRAGDPHLHTHVLVANLVWCPDDGRWSALDGRSLYGWAKTVGFLYEAQLRAELTRRLGVAWTPLTNGIADIDGIPRKVLRAFSRRRQKIEMHMEERGETGARAAQRATYATRGRKHDTSTESLLPEWRARAAALGLDDAALASLLGGGRTVLPAPGTPVAEALFMQLASPTGLTARATSFGRREVLQEIAARLPQGGTIDQIVALADGFLTSEHVIPLGGQVGLRTSDVIRRTDGRVVAVHVDEQRWTTPEMLATERWLINMAIDRQHDHICIARPDDVDAALKARPSLSDEQVRMVRRLTTSGAGIEAVEGVAGSGKTYALAAAHDAWYASGHRVIGCALAARAAAQLEAESAIPSMTLDRFVRQLDRSTVVLDGRTVVVVDEAAMVGTRKLAQLLDRADAAGSKVVLVGDHHQLPEIDAGGAFAGIRARLQGDRLVENRRQVETWERQALAQLRDGDPDTAFTSYKQHGRVVHLDDPEQLRERLVDDWWAARSNGSDALMLAGRNDDVDDLNRRARARLVASGRLGPYDLVVRGRGFAIGDEILTTRNDYRVGVLNGTRGTITDIDHNHGELRIHADGHEVLLPWSYVAAGHVTHGYAVTFHKAQGLTVREALVLADGTLDRERAYTGMSRGTHSNRLYITDPPDERAEERHAPEPANDAVARARRQLGRTLAHSMAIDQLEPHRAPPEGPDLGPDLGP
jgi:conjugative relaxase-like TrwC/TraI family protein